MALAHFKVLHGIYFFLRIIRNTSSAQLAWRATKPRLLNRVVLEICTAHVYLRLWIQRLEYIATNFGVFLELGKFDSLCLVFSKSFDLLELLTWWVLKSDVVLGVVVAWAHIGISLPQSETVSNGATAKVLYHFAETLGFGWRNVA